jgi:phospholipase/carboxylesterase
MEKVVIWLHGLGATADDFESIVPMLKLPKDSIRFIFPQAPVQAVTINNGYEMPAWFDILGLKDQSPEDEVGIARAEKNLRALIEKEIERSVDSKNIILAGFSQGGAVALYTGLRYEKPLGGILALSTYLPLASKLSEEKNEANHAIPIFMAHGKHDDVISLDIAENVKQLLTSLNYKIDWHVYDMAHSVCMEEIEDISKFLQ